MGCVHEESYRWKYGAPKKTRTGLAIPEEIDGNGCSDCCRRALRFATFGIGGGDTIRNTEGRFEYACMNPIRVMKLDLVFCVGIAGGA